MDIIQSFQQNNTEYNITIRGTLEAPLFRATDIAEILGIVSIRSTVADFPDDDKCHLSLDTPGGKQNVLFLTEPGVYHILYVSRKPIAAEFRRWVSNVLKTIRLTGIYDANKEKQLRLEAEQKLAEAEEMRVEAEKALAEARDEMFRQQHERDIVKETNEKLTKEVEMLREMEVKPVIYIYDTHTKKHPTGHSILKMGVSGTHGRTAGRTAQFKALVSGELMYYKALPLNCDAPTKAEMFIHHLLHRFNAGAKETFEISYAHAEAVVHAVVGLVHATYVLDEASSCSAIQNIADSVNRHVFGVYTDNGRTTVEIQTDLQIPALPDDKVQEQDNDEAETVLNQFLQDRCILSSDSETPTKVLEGELRLYLGAASKEMYLLLQKFLEARFANVRVPVEGADNVVYGYRGVAIKETYVYKLPTDVKDYHLFLLAECRISPEAKIHRSSLEERYAKWKKATDRAYTKGEFEEFMRYLDKHPRFLKKSVHIDKAAWGFYGLCMLDDPIYRKKTSSTGKTIEKRTKEHVLLKRYPTIAKAAEENKLPPTKLSRLLKSNTAQFDDYYFVVV